MDAWQKRAKATIKAGESPTQIVFFQFVPRRDPNTKKIIMGPTGKPKVVPVLRIYLVYNAEQMQPLSPETEAKLQRYLTQPMIVNTEPDFDPAEAIVKATGARISFGGNRACYDFSKDGIRLPSKRSFKSMPDYYETAFHELSHWAMHPTRIGTRKRYENEYAFNELVAEIAACFLCARVEIPHADQMLESSKAYVGHWLKAMGNDTRYIIEAATHASKLTDFILACEKTLVKEAG
jgi:antirestriction protein ArdC